MTSQTLLESLDRHYLTGCPSLSTAQLREHKATGTCPECRNRALKNGSAATAAARED